MSNNKILSLPALFKQTATGAVQEWRIEVYAIRGFGEIVTSYGQVGGQFQVTSDLIESGKNLGRSNETTPLEQARVQAKQQWDKKKKSGYTEDISQAESTSNTLGAIKPMLAHVYDDHRAKATFPAFAQPKLDGLRCIAIIKDGKCRLYSRTQKEWLTVPHIVAAVEHLASSLGWNNFVLDGELYNHDFKHDFNRITSIVKRKDAHPDHGLVQYHIYDLPHLPGGFSERLESLARIAEFDVPGLKAVHTASLLSENDLQNLMGSFLEQGYEGLMYRSADGKYENKRSSTLLKVKTFQDDEFEAIGVEEGNGKLQGRAGSITCRTKDGKIFNAKMVGAQESLVDYLVNFDSKYCGRPLTVKFQNLTPDGVPRFPVGIRFREDE